jgi:hypothetical protein
MKTMITLSFLGSLALFGAPNALTQEAKAPEPAKKLPYTAVHHPKFITADHATFMNPDDRVIGLMIGQTAKAYPAGIVGQHGLVEDDAPKGPIAITW